MGWLWTTPTHPPSSVPVPEKNPQDSLQSAAPTPPSAPPSETSADASSKPLSRDSLAEQELYSFLKELEADTRPSSSKYDRIPRSPPPTTSKTSQTTSVPTLGPVSEQLLPTTMSCRNAFDEAFYCNSFGGRFNDLYRYGTLRSCSENWNDFWFCMRTRGYGDREKEAAIKEHYRRKESAKYSKELGKESSEDVWKSRTTKLEWGEAFNQPYEELKESDEEWRKSERERRALDAKMGRSM
jgi:hypothetical protein